MAVSQRCQLQQHCEQQKVGIDNGHIRKQCECVSSGHLSQVLDGSGDKRDLHVPLCAPQVSQGLTST